MTPGDVVRIGDLPIGAVVRDESGCELCIGERSAAGNVKLHRAHSVGDGPWSPYPVTTTMVFVSLPPVEAAPVEPPDPPCKRCKGSGVDPVRVGDDPDWCSECGGCGLDGEAMAMREEAEAVRHWWMKHRDAEAALARVTAERDEARKERDGFVAVLADSEKERARAHREMRTLSAVRDAMRIERDAALAQVTALQEAVAENGRLRAEKEIDRGAAAIWEKLRGLLVDHTKSLETTLAERDTELRAECARLRTVATGYATTRRDRDAVATICEALCTSATPYAATPDGALLAIRDLRAELSEHAARTQEARETLAACVSELDYERARGDGLQAVTAALDIRDAQEGDRIAAWSYATGRAPCARCWYPTLFIGVGAPELCDACKGDDESAQESAPYVCPGCHAVGGERCAPDCIDESIRRDMEQELFGDERASAEEGDDGK